MRKTLRWWIATLSTAALLTACGGGGSDTPATAANPGNPSSPATSTPPPASGATLAQTVNDTPELSTLKAAVLFVDEASDDKLMPQLMAAGDKTLFAPNNAAFDKLAVDLIGPGSKASDLLTAEYKDDLRDILKTNLLGSRMVTTSFVNGTSLAVDLGSSTVAISSASASATSTGSSSVSVSVSSSSSSSATASAPAGSATSTMSSTSTSTSTVTVNSFSLTIKIANGVITITDGQGRVTTIKLGNIVTINGVIHITDNVMMPPKPMLGKSILDVAQKTPELSSLVKAVIFASKDLDLIKLLGKRGTLTVFAPTNDAFNALAAELLGPGKTATDLLVPANRDLVRSVLQYHVLGTVVPKADIPFGKPIDPLLEGKDIFKIDKVGDKIVINDGRNRKSEITATDIKAKNGVVHVINKVILPADKDIVETALASKPEFSILVEAVVAADLAGGLKGAGPLTVLAPTNEAFSGLLAELKITKAALLADKALLTKVLTYHVIPALVLKADVPINTPVKTLQGETLTVDSGFKITDQRGRKSSIVVTDVLAKNGVIHAIDHVILPKP